MSKKLSRKELRKMKKNFKSIDADGDGKITKEEFKNAYMKECDMDEGILEGIIDEIWAEYDDDGDGHIDFKEYCQKVLDSQQQEEMWD